MAVSNLEKPGYKISSEISCSQSQVLLGREGGLACHEPLVSCTKYNYLTTQQQLSGLLKGAHCELLKNCLQKVLSKYAQNYKIFYDKKEYYNFQSYLSCGQEIMLSWSIKMHFFIKKVCIF